MAYWTPDHVRRMFPRTTVRWVHKVHEHPECDLPEKRLSGYIEHHTYRDWKEWEEKLCLYTTIWPRCLVTGKWTSMECIFHIPYEFFQDVRLRKGFDGAGQFQTVLQSNFYTMLKHLKLHEPR